MAVTVINNENFSKEVIESSKPVLIDFWAEWCGPCKMLSPIVDEIANEVSDVKICKVNVDNENELARKYKIMSIPTLKYFKNGEVVDTMIGLHSKYEIKEMISK